MKINTLAFSLYTLIAAMVAFIGLMCYSAFTRDDTPNQHFDKDWGRVTNITSCQKYKHSLVCRVETDLFVLPSIDITDFPNDMVVLGDRIGLRNTLFDGRVETFYTQNGRQIAHGTCFNWMPCRKNYPPDS